MQNRVVLADCRASTGRLLRGVCQPLEALNSGVLSASLLWAPWVLTPLWDLQAPVLALRKRRSAESCRDAVPAKPLPFSHRENGMFARLSELGMIVYNDGSAGRRADLP